MKIEEYLEQLLSDIVGQKLKFDNDECLANYIESRMKSQGYMVDKKTYQYPICWLPSVIHFEFDIYKYIYESVLVITKIYTEFFSSFYLALPSDNICAFVIKHGLTIDSDFQSLKKFLNNLNEIKVFDCNQKMVDLIKMKGNNFKIEDNKVVVYTIYDDLNNSKYNLGYLIKGGSSFYPNSQIDFKLYFEGNPSILSQFPKNLRYYIETLIIYKK